MAVRIASVVNCPNNRAGVRLLMACMLAKAHLPDVDPRKPYTKIGGKDCFSGRTYEMKNKPVLKGDIDRALQKIAAQGQHVQNCIFITTEAVMDDVREYARSKYDETGGVEIALLDCVGFIRHFLHLFYRLRKDFLDQYQILVLREPNSAVSQALKEAFLALRQAAESAD